MVGLGVITPADAVDYSGPTITSVADGDTVSGVHRLTASSQAPYVLFLIVDGSSGYGNEMIRAQVPVTDGVAGYDWPTWGFDDGAHISAVDCSSGSPGTCGSASSQISVGVEVPTDTLDAPTEPLFTNPDVDGPLTVTVGESSAGGDLYVWWRGGTREAATPGQPTDLTFPDVDYGYGPLRVLRCNPVNKNICALTSSPSAEVTVRRRLTPTAWDVDPYVFSPDGNGTLDVSTVRVTFDRVEEQSATWQVTRLDGTPLMDTPQPVPLEPGAYGNVDVVVDPVAAGLKLGSGRYRVQIDTEGRDHGYDFVGQTSELVQVDVDGPRITSLTPNLGTVYPYSDGHRDSVTVRVGVEGETASSGKVEVLNSSGVVVDTDYLAWFGDGEAFSWDGRTDSAKLAPAGQYRFRVTLSDDRGNRSTYTGGAVTVSSKRLVSKVWVKTVTAARSLGRDDSGRCSSLRIPGLHGWRGSVGYLSQSKCTGTASGMSRIAVGLHAARMPQVFRAQSVRISAYGGSSKAGTGHRAGLLWFTKGGDLAGSAEVLGHRVAWHRADSRTARKVVRPDRWLVWGVTTGSGQRYDVGKFKISFSYLSLE